MRQVALSRTVAIVTVVFFPAAVLGALLLARVAGGAAWQELSDGAALAIPFGAFGLVGALILSRRPGNVIGGICVAMATLYALTLVAIAYAGWGLASGSRPPGTLAAIWLANWTWYPIIGAASVGVPLLIPDGRLLSSRWRWVGVLGAASVGGMAALAMVHPRLSTFAGDTTIPNPLGVRGVPSPIDSTVSNALSIALVVAFVGAVASVIVRYRRAAPAERARLKWIVFAFVLVLVIDLALELIQAVFVAGGLSNGVFAVVWSLLPAGLGIAVLRHRLFDIDRVISRTVSYAIVTVVLAALYVAAVVGLGNLLRTVSGGGGGDLVVAGSTLLVAVAFGPVRRRAQSSVDRRFDRARHDATRVLERFSYRLRDEVDIDRLTDDIHRVAREVVQPTHATLWLRGSDASP